MVTQWVWEELAVGVIDVHNGKLKDCITGAKGAHDWQTYIECLRYINPTFYRGLYI